jgi:hypothetical protein
MKQNVGSNALLLVIGGGKFGHKAVQYGLNNNYKVLFIDSDPACMASRLATKTYLRLPDFLENITEMKEHDAWLLLGGMEVVYEVLLRISPNYIIPVVPIHVLSELFQLLMNERFSRKLEPEQDYAQRFVQTINQEIMLYHDTDHAIVYLSHAKSDEICPDNCFGPENYCPTFHREKLFSISSYLKDYFECKNSYTIRDEKRETLILLESYQITGGIGGLKGEEVKHIISSIRKDASNFVKNNFRIIIATSCNCHGVINFLKS